VVIVVALGCQLVSDLGIDLNISVFKRASLSLPLKLSMKAFSVGLPGRMKASYTALESAQASITIPANSLPLSTGMDVGLPRSRTAISRASATSLPFSLGLPRMATHSLVNWSTTVRIRKDRPSSRRAATKSMLHP